MILAGLFETIIVHALLRLELQVLGLSVDRVFRKLLPFAVYPALVIGWILKGNELEWAILAMSIVIFSVGLCGAFLAHRRVHRIHRKRKEVIQALVALDLENEQDQNDEHVTQVMQEAFDTFDLDHSQKLEKSEVRLILKAMYPDMSRKNRSLAMKAVTADEIAFEDFADCIEAWHDIAVRSPMIRKSSSVLARLGFKKRMQKKLDAFVEQRVHHNWHKIGKAWSKDDTMLGKSRSLPNPFAPAHEAHTKHAAAGRAWSTTTRDLCAKAAAETAEQGAGASGRKGKVGFSRADDQVRDQVTELAV